MTLPLWAHGPVTQEHGFLLLWAHEAHFILFSAPRTLGRTSVIKRTEEKVESTSSCDRWGH